MSETDRDPRPALGSWIRQCLNWDELSRLRSPTTLGRYRHLVDAHVIPLLGSKPLRQLEANDIEKALQWMIDQGFPPAMVDDFHRIVHHACREAVARKGASQAIPLLER
jgi:hypothetical protein